MRWRTGPAAVCLPRLDVPAVDFAAGAQTAGPSHAGFDGDERPRRGGVDQLQVGAQFTSWAFTQRALDSGLSQSMGSIGGCFDNAVIESFWARMQVELLNRRRWRTRIELSNAIFEYLEIFHNRQQRHSSLDILTPVEYEIRHTTAVARNQAS